MTSAPNIASPGSNINYTNLFYFSTCSINAFKTVLLSEDKKYGSKIFENVKKLFFFRNTSTTGECLKNEPIKSQDFFRSQELDTNINQNNSLLLGQLYTADNSVNYYMVKIHIIAMV